MSVLQDTSQQTRPISYLIKIGITVVLLFFIIRGVSLDKAMNALINVAPLGLVIAFILQGCSGSVAAYRWFLIMRRVGFKPTFPFYWKSYFKGAFFNQGLPTSIGGDGIRILDCTRDDKRAIDAFYGVFIDRIVGLAGLLFLNLGALLFNSSLLPSKIYYLLLAIIFLFILGIISLFFLHSFPIFHRGRWFSMLGTLSERFTQVYSNDISIQLFLSILIHLLAISAFYSLGLAGGLNYPLSVYLIMVPPVILLTILPISLAGWGVREGALIGFFLLIGADRTKVLSFSLLYGLITIATSLPGLYFYLNDKNKL
ncbi:MAG: flippase-like domain-containing protein [Desulfobulbaceae bacterium]|nr:flippase-like domain-containing protein [Desulfobulbaceae bacterium]